MNSLLMDVRYALRQLARAPVFTAVAVLTLALAIGANATMFSIVNGVLIEPLPYANADRLVRVYTANPEQSVREGAVSLPDLEDWRTQASSFGAMAGYQGMATILTGREDPLELRSAFVTEDFFGVLGSDVQLGRPLTPVDSQQASRSIVISDRLWRSAFAADPAIVGSTARLDGQPYTVVGVAPRDFRFPTPETDVWGPYSVLSEMQVGRQIRTARVLQGVARLVDGVSIEQAQAELTTLAASLALEYPDSNARWNAATVVPLRTTIVGAVDRALVVVFGVVGFMLLIGCANLANLLLARGVSRSKEIAIRTSLGAAPIRIVRQLLTETLVLALLGCLVGLALSVVGVQTVLALSGDTLPRAEDVRIDGRVIGFALLLAGATGLLFGLLPALRIAVAPLANDLKSRGFAGRHSRRLASALVVAEVSLAVVLVIGAGLMSRSFLELRSVDPGFDPDSALAVTVQYNVADVPVSDIGSHLVRRRAEIIDRLAALPGVTDVGVTNSLPLRADVWEPWEFTRTDGSGAPDEILRMEGSYVSSGYLDALGVPLLRGEPLPAQVDLFSGGAVPVLINATSARRFWPGQEAVGRVIRSNRGGFQMRIAGVVGDVRQRGLAAEPPPAMYLPQALGLRIVNTFVVRTAGDAPALVAPIRRVIQELDPNQPIRSITTMGGVMSESIARDRFFTILFGVFGGLALVLATVGVYGVIAHSVSQRSQEIGVRIALGARAADVLRMVVVGGMRLVLAGVLIGGLSALVLGRVLESQLHGVNATDPLAFTVAFGVLISVAALACYVPARRATRVDPMLALREE